MPAIFSDPYAAPLTAAIVGFWRFHSAPGPGPWPYGGCRPCRRDPGASRGPGAGRLLTLPHPPVRVQHPWQRGLGVPPSSCGEAQPLAAGEPGRALLTEGLTAFCGVLGRPGEEAETPLVVRVRIEFQQDRAVHRKFPGRVRLRRAVGEFMNERGQVVLVRLDRPDADDDAVALGLNGVNYPPGDEQIHSPRLSNEPGQDQRDALPGEDGLAGADIPHEGVRPGDTEVTGERDDPARAMAAAVDRRDHRLRDGQQLLHHLVMESQVRAEPAGGTVAG